MIIRFYTIIKYWATSIFLLLFFYTANSQCNNDSSEFPFSFNEKITYHAVYNWGWIWVKAGTVSFETSTSEYEGKGTLKLVGRASSLKSYDWLFKVRDLFQTYVNPQNMQPYFFDRSTSEGSYSVKNKYWFDYDSSLIYTDTWNSNKEKVLDTLQLQTCTFDVISGVYFVRSLDFDKYEVNDTIPVRMIIDNEIFNLYLRYLGKEVLKTRDKRKFNTIKFSALLVEGTIFKGGEDLFIWVTDDANRIPVLIEAKILVGSIKAVLIDPENLKFPLSSEIIE